MELILASASPRRKELLEQIGVNFKIIPSLVDEEAVELCGTVEEKAEKLALVKAEDVAGRLQKGIVIGADTIVVVDDVIYGKPKDDSDAYRMLKSLNGREHKVITGLALINIENNSIKIAHETTLVRFQKLKDEELLSYIDSKEPEGKAGAYAIQGKGALLVEKIEGCYSNVVGFPINRFKKMIEEIIEVKLLT